MPDRLVDLYNRIAQKVDALDAAIGGARGKGADAQLHADWQELAAMVREQKQHLGEITRRTQELSSLSA